MTNKKGLINGKVIIDGSIPIEKLDLDNYSTDEAKPKSLVTVEFLMQEIEKLKNTNK